MIAKGVDRELYAVAVTPEERDAILSVLEDPPDSLGELRGALARDFEGASGKDSTRPAHSGNIAVEDGERVGDQVGEGVLGGAARRAGQLLAARGRRGGASLRSPAGAGKFAWDQADSEHVVWEPGRLATPPPSATSHSLCRFPKSTC
jgi:hypothetical protein